MTKQMDMDDGGLSVALKEPPQEPVTNPAGASPRTSAPAAPGQRGRPRKAAAGRTPPREAPDAARDNVLGDGAIRSRTGEILRRQRRDGIDQFFIPESLKQPGWSYQWNAVTVTGNSDVVRDKGLGYYYNGWRPCDHKQFPGLFGPPGASGEIMRGGCRLEERPDELTVQALIEQRQLAQDQMNTRNQSIMGALAGNLGAGMAMPNALQNSRMLRDTGGSNLRVSIDPRLTVPERAGNYVLDKG